MSSFAMFLPSRANQLGAIHQTMFGASLFFGGFVCLVDLVWLEDTPVVYSLTIFTVPSALGLNQLRFLFTQHFWAVNFPWLRLFFGIVKQNSGHWKKHLRAENRLFSRPACQHNAWLLLIRKDLSPLLHCACWIWNIGKGCIECFNSGKRETSRKPGQLANKTRQSPHSTQTIDHRDFP